MHLGSIVPHCTEMASMPWVCEVHLDFAENRLYFPPTSCGNYSSSISLCGPGMPACLPSLGMLYYKNVLKGLSKLIYNLFLIFQFVLRLTNVITSQFYLCTHFKAVLRDKLLCVFRLFVKPTLCMQVICY